MGNQFSICNKHCNYEEEEEKEAVPQLNLTKKNDLQSKINV